MVNPEMLAIAFLLAVANNAIVDYLANPVRKRFPDFDLWFLPYVAFVTGGVIAYIADVNLFAFIPGLVAVPGRLLTAAVIGGGAGLIHKVFDHADVEPLREIDASAYVLTDAGREQTTPDSVEEKPGTPCPVCGQIDFGQERTGEHPCPECGLPWIWDDPVSGELSITTRAQNDG